jgi:hypothetical protein
VINSDGGVTVMPVSECDHSDRPFVTHDSQKNFGQKAKMCPILLKFGTNSFVRIFLKCNSVTVSGTDSDSLPVTCDIRKFSEILRACDP